MKIVESRSVDYGAAGDIKITGKVPTSCSTLLVRGYDGCGSNRSLGVQMLDHDKPPVYLPYESVFFFSFVML